MTDKAFYHEVPNMADDDLDIYSYRLYGHYRRVIGNNGSYCDESIRELAATCGISTGKVSEARRDLEKKGLIRVEDVPGPGRSIAGSRVYLVDVWAQNAARYRRQDADQDVERETPPTPSSHEQGCSSGERGCSWHEQGCSPGERSINNQNRSTTRGKTNNHHHRDSKSPQSPGALPPSPIDDDTSQWEFIFEQIASWNLLGYGRELLRSRAPAESLALVNLAQHKARDNPAGYLVALLQGQQTAGESEIELAQLALEMGTLDESALRRERFRRDALKYGWGI